MTAKPKKFASHLFWKGAEGPLLIAHRGGAGALGKLKYKHENTIKSFQAARQMGYEYIEMDAILTSDNEVIVVHVAKNRLEALLGKKDAPNYQQLQKKTYDEIKSILERDIPLLEDVIKKFPQAKFFIDAKTDEVIEPLAKIIENTRSINRVCVGSFYASRVEKLREQLGGEACLQFIISRSPLHYIQSWNNLKDEQWRKKVNLAAVAWPYMLIDQKTVNKMHDWGLKALVWTPNNRRSIKKAIKSGADGIISDNARLLKRITKG